MEGEGIADVREWNRKKLVAMGVYEPTEDDIKAKAAADEAANQPTPEQEFLAAESAKSEALAVKAAADTELSRAKTDETKAKTIETLSGVERDDRQQVIDLATDLDKDEVQRLSAQPSFSASNGIPPGLMGE